MRDILRRPHVCLEMGHTWAPIRADFSAIHGRGSWDELRLRYAALLLLGRVLIRVVLRASCEAGSCDIEFYIELDLRIGVW